MDTFFSTFSAAKYIGPNFVKTMWAYTEEPIDSKVEEKVILASIRLGRQKLLKKLSNVSYTNESLVPFMTHPSKVHVEWEKPLSSIHAIQSFLKILTRIQNKAPLNISQKRCLSNFFISIYIKGALKDGLNIICKNTSIIFDDNFIFWLFLFTKYIDESKDIELQEREVIDNKTLHTAFKIVKEFLDSLKDLKLSAEKVSTLDILKALNNDDNFLTDNQEFNDLLCSYRHWQIRFCNASTNNPVSTNFDLQTSNHQKPQNYLELYNKVYDQNIGCLVAETIEKNQEPTKQSVFGSENHSSRNTCDSIYYRQCLSEMAKPASKVQNIAQDLNNFKSSQTTITLDQDVLFSSKKDDVTPQTRNGTHGTASGENANTISAHQELDIIFANNISTQAILTSKIDNSATTDNTQVQKGISTGDQNLVFKDIYYTQLQEKQKLQPNCFYTSIHKLRTIDNTTSTSTLTSSMNTTDYKININSLFVSYDGIKKNLRQSINKFLSAYKVKKLHNTNNTLIKKINHPSDKLLKKLDKIQLKSQESTEVYIFNTEGIIRGFLKLFLSGSINNIDYIENIGFKYEFKKIHSSLLCCSNNIRFTL
ncbi:hypothetical protein OAO18_06370 [Francisellaceae bacterium]|nr:hypothetical protein [Francisellaceae bacterium]